MHNISRKSFAYFSKLKRSTMPDQVLIELAEEFISNERRKEIYCSIAKIDEISDSTAQENPFNETSNIAEEFTCIEMEEISNSVKKMLENSALHSGISGRCSIHKVPELFHKMTEPSKYRPQSISIGPFHCRDQSLKANEGLKLRYAYSLLARMAKKRYPQEEDDLANAGWLIIFEECVALVKKMETKVRRCYSEPIDLNSGEFVKMMVIDGLFIIQLFIKNCLGEVTLQNNLLIGNMVINDLFLLENQLPLFVLKCLFDQIELPAKIGWWRFMDLIVYSLSYYIRDLVPEGLIHLNSHREQCEDAKHLLDLLGIMLHLLSEEETSADEPVQHHKIPSAAELNRAGVRFKRGLKNQRFVDIKFRREEGIFEIPPTYIYCGTDTMVRNLIACEQLYSGRYNMISYSHLMDSLINSAEDVAVLRKAGILESFLGCDEDVANFFNKLGSEVILKGNSYLELQKEVIKYYRKRRHVWKATLKREYFNNPWAIISVCAAVLLILLTIISTVFGILQVVSPNK